MLNELIFFLNYENVRYIAMITKWHFLFKIKTIELKKEKKNGDTRA